MPGSITFTLNDIDKSPVLFITGDIAHSEEFSEDAYKRVAKQKELFINRMLAMWTNTTKQHNTM